VPTFRLPHEACGQSDTDDAALVKNYPEFTAYRLLKIAHRSNDEHRTWLTKGQQKLLFRYR